MAKKMSPKNKETVFTKFLDNDGCNNLRISLDRLLMRPSWWIASKKILSSIKPLPRTKRARGVEDYLSLSDYKNQIIRAIRKSDRQKTPIIFENTPDSTFGIAIPIVSESKAVGFMGVCGVKKKPVNGLCDLIESYVDMILHAIEKDGELTKVYEIVRPRAIALSTVHTIHRLTSAVLNTKELFPRIARLALQVLKAERVSICLINQETQSPYCVASVDYRKSKDLFKLSSRPAATEVGVASTGRSIFKKNILSMPLVDDEICGVISVRDKVGKESFTIFDQEILTTLSEQAVIAIRNAQLYQEQEELTIGIIKSLGYLLDAKFPRLYTHTRFFVDLMLELGKELGLTKKELKVLHYSALLPDLGKVVMPEEILHKKKALSGKERKILKTHTLRGIEVLQYLDVLKPVIPIIVHHHEKYNGTGYPDRLRGNNIPLGARIMAIVDTLEAMVCHRPYRKPVPFRMAVSEIRRQSGKQFDPDVVGALMDLAKDGRLEELVTLNANELKKHI